MKKDSYSLEELISGLRDQRTFKFKRSGSVFYYKNDKLIDSLTEIKGKINSLESKVY